MNRISRKFQSLKAQNRKALIIYLTAGYPSLEETQRLVLKAEEAGADLIELGVPFSDPIADGPTIQYASQKALEKGATLEKILRLVHRLRRRTEIPLILMSYLNPIHRMGYEVFSCSAARCGVDGLIIPDLIPEESGPIRKHTVKNGLSLILLTAPTTPSSRRHWIDKQSRGFVYAVSVAGVTGARKDISSDAIGFLKDMNRGAKNPIALGFGISKPEHIRRFGRYVQGFIIGSAIINRLRAKEPITGFIKGFRRRLDAFRP
ncbi:MAG TPA: tryptophan synthase subunit alpha [Elusimicrobiota bacterium]|nr:tryptophan synthase subunit alpha [Elusimicrobiota bacterium]